MFTTERITSIVIAASVLLVSLTSAERQNRELMKEQKGSDMKSSAITTAFDDGDDVCEGLPEKVVVANKHYYYADGHGYRPLTTDYGWASHSDGHPGGKLITGNSPICKVHSYDNYVTLDDIKECAYGKSYGESNEIGSASGVCTIVSIDDYVQETHFECLLKEVLFFDSDYDTHFKGGYLMHFGAKTSPDQAVIGGTGAFKGATGSIHKTPLKYKFHGHYAHAGWVYDLTHVKCKH